ncbi:alpha/beta hydrolase [Actinokineospora auranticolor]|uniref:Pimeloyl-ACP methyl ester carboxylesterase n=1 Tax=Actinokineospora auranticolor TaxID=155976 RepID=A0A2S6H1J9_9PSEU|nr:alpha/beta hydrolase [Actinokineospora auranticolor]PPK71368.1 pimeloyl-ACP methyl ester carboxylesterase [Actinokineospora auranticolor]
MVLLHGGPGTPAEGISATGRALAAAGFDVYSYDQLGSGRSTRLDDPSGYTVARHVADLEAVRDRLGAGKLVLVGQSWGGSLAAQYLAAHPDRVARAVFASPGELWPRAWRDGVGEPRLNRAQRDRRDDLVTSPRLLLASALLSVNPRAAHDFLGDAEADRRMREIGVAIKDATGCPGAPPAAVHDNPPGFYANQRTVADFDDVPDPRPALRAVRVPALVLRGECDYIKEAVTAEYTAVLAGATLVTVPGAGHNIAAARPDAHRDLITAFLLDEPLPQP